MPKAWPGFRPPTPMTCYQRERFMDGWVPPDLWEADRAVPRVPYGCDQVPHRVHVGCVRHSIPPHATARVTGAEGRSACFPTAPPLPLRWSTRARTLLRTATLDSPKPFSGQRCTLQSECGA